MSKPHPREATAPEIVIPAKAGIQAGVEWGNGAWGPLQDPWIPAFAGMTEGGGDEGCGYGGNSTGTQAGTAQVHINRRVWY